MIACTRCGRRHLLTSMIPDPDDPGRLLCPVREARGVMRLWPAERAEADRLLFEALGMSPD